MKRLSDYILSVMFAVALGFAGARAQQPPNPPAERPFSIIKADPALDEIVSADAKLETLGEHFGLTEGAVWIQEGTKGYLLFSDMLSNVIYKWTPDAPLSVFLESAGYTGKDVLNVGQQTTRGRMAVLLIGPNGLTLDNQGRLIICAMPDRTVVRLEKDGTRTILADRFEGKRFSGPNDVAMKSNGSLYFTDSPSGLRGADQSPAKELPFMAFYLVKDGKVQALDKDPQNSFPNGIALSPDEKYLYVSAGRKTLRYEVQPDDTVANGQVFIDAGSDGIKVDQKGNVYTTTGGGVRITTPGGKQLGTIQLPIILTEPRPRVCTTNVAFGDADNKTLYITACTHLFRIRLNSPGIRPGPKP